MRRPLHARARARARTLAFAALVALAPLGATASSSGCAPRFGTAVVPGASSAAGARALTGDEIALQERNGFVISREEAPSFHYGYTTTFRAHQPVYFTADAFLHAWHASYDAILATLETDALAPELGVMLDELRVALAKSTAPAEAKQDVAQYVDVAASLLKGAPITKECEALVKQAEAASGEATISLFGAPISVDLSQLKPRGHYTQSKELTQYFRAMMWLGRTEVRLAQKDASKPGDAAWTVNRRAVRGLALFRALFTPRAEKAWHVLDDATAALVGPADSMSLPGFDRARAGLDLD